jgi:hypothetical protein
MSAKWKMAPFHGMALLILGIGYLLHAEPFYGKRDIGKYPVLPLPEIVPIFFVSRITYVLCVRMCVTMASISHTYRYISPVLHNFIFTITRSWSNFSHVRGQVYKRATRKSFLLSNIFRATLEKMKTEVSNTLFAHI